MSAAFAACFVVGLVLVAWGFAAYLDVVGAVGPEVGQATAAVRGAAQAVGAVLAGPIPAVVDAVSSRTVSAGGVARRRRGRQGRAVLQHPTAAQQQQQQPPPAAGAEGTQSSEDGGGDPSTPFRK